MKAQFGTEEEGANPRFRTVELSTLSPARAARIVRRKASPRPIAWIEPARHALFVLFIVALAFTPGNLATKLGAMCFALAYASFLAGRDPSKDRDGIESIDEKGITQSWDGQTHHVPWSDISAYTAPAIALDGFGLIDRDGRLKALVGRDLEEGGGPVTRTLWTRLTKSLVSRLSFEPMPADSQWRAFVRANLRRFAFHLMGMVLCLSPAMLSEAAKDGGYRAWAVFFAAVCGLLVVGPSVSLGSLRSDASVPFANVEADGERRILNEFLDSREGDLRPEPLHFGQRYRYVVPNLLTKESLAYPDQDLPWFIFIGALQAIRLIDHNFAALIGLALMGLIAYGKIYNRRLGSKLLEERDAEFSVEGDDLVVRRADREERYPLASARNWSLGRYWFDFGGEVEEYRNGRQRILIDRRFLVPVPPNKPCAEGM